MQAFKIIYQGVALDVTDNARLTVEFVSAVFNEDKILTGSYSYPITFPLTVKNRNIFGEAHYLENRLARKSFDVDVELFGMSWKKARLTYDVTSSGYEGQLLIDIGTVADWMRDRPLNSIFTVSNNGLFVAHKSISIGTSAMNVRANILDSCTNVGKYPWVFFPIVNENVFGGREEAQLQTNIVNQFDHDGTSDFFISNTGFYTPFFYVSWVIREVCKFLGYEATGSFLDDDFVRSLVIYNNGVVRKSLLQQREIYPAQHLPSLSISNFFKALRNDMKCAIYFDSLTRTAHFETAQRMLRTRRERDVVDLSARVEHGSIKIHHNEVSGYMLKSKIDDADGLYEVRPYVKSYLVGDLEKAKSVDMAIGSLFMREDSKYYGTINVRLPHVQQICNVYDDSYDYVDGVYNPPSTYNKNEFELRFLSYKGTFSKLNYLGRMMRVPYATSDSKDINGADVYPVTAEPGGEKGFLNKMCLDWYAYLLRTERVEARALVDVLSFSKINPLRPILLPGHMKSKVACLMDKVVFEPKPNSSLINARLTVYPNYNDVGAEVQQIAFVEDEIVVPEEKVYVVLRYYNCRYTINKKKEKKKEAQLQFFFYKDPLLSIPTSVRNLKVYVKETWTGDRHHNFVRAHTVTAEGSVIIPGDNVIYYYERGAVWGLFKSTEYNVIFSLDTSPTASYEMAGPAPEPC